MSDDSPSSDAESILHRTALVTPRTAGPGPHSNNTTQIRTARSNYGRDWARPLFTTQQQPVKLQALSMFQHESSHA